jgi:hypothetical protein
MSTRTGEVGMIRRSVIGAFAVALAFGCGMGTGLLLGGGAAGAQTMEIPPEADLIRAGLQDLERINRMLKDAIEDYEGNRIDEETLRKRIRNILERKEETIADLFRWYEVYGGSFAQWYFRFSRLDRFLDESFLRSQLEEILSRGQISGPLKNAERLKKDIERELRDRLKEIEQG